MLGLWKKEHRFDQNRGVLFSEIHGLIKLWASAFQPGDRKTHSMDLRRIKSQSDVDLNEGLVDRRVESRTGVHVESEKCSSVKVRHVVLDVKNDCFVRHNDSC